MDNQLNSRQRRKLSAATHNAALEIRDKIWAIGACAQCQSGTVFMYMESNDDNVFRYYCSECKHVGDIRNPTDGDVFYTPPQSIIDILKVHYGEDKIGELFDKKEVPLED